MTSLGFENYAEALKIYLSKYREVINPKPMDQSSPPQSSQSFPSQDSFPTLQSGAARASQAHLLTRPQTQSARGENQRPPSAGYGAGGPVGGPGGPGPARPTSFADAEGANPMLNPNMDPSEQDASAYGYPAMVGQSHNGAGGEQY
jgi:nuclear transcription Y subunit beta